MRPALTLIGAAIAIAGLVWLAQGLNLPFAPRSFMTSDRLWAFLGAIAVVAGVTLLLWARGRAPR